MASPLAKSIFTVCLAMMVVHLCLAETKLPERPSPPRLVNDLADIFSDSQDLQLETRLTAYDDSTSTQIVVLTVSDLSGMEVADYAISVGRQWGIGQKEKDNGLVILIAPNERKVFIATGYGLEAKLPDVIASRIIREIMLPEFSKGDFFSGLNLGIDQIQAALAGEFASNARGSQSGRQIMSYIFVALVFILVIIIVSRRGGGNGGRTISSTGPFMFWGSPGFRGSSFSSGGGSGGFGGFGGGSFGGGGAGGSW